MKKTVISNINTDMFNPFGAREEELIADALESACLVNEATRVNDKPAKDVLKIFHTRRENFKISTKLGNLLVQNNIISQAQLDHALRIQHESPDKKLGDILQEQQFCIYKHIESILKKQAEIRRNLEELDSLKKQMHLLFSKLESFS